MKDQQTVAGASRSREEALALIAEAMEAATVEINRQAAEATKAMAAGLPDLEGADIQ